MFHKIEVPDLQKRGGQSKEFAAKPSITPPAGGVFTPVEGWAYPYKGHPPELAVEVLAAIKGTIPVVLRYVERCIKTCDLLAFWNLSNTFQEMRKYVGKSLKRLRPKYPKRYGKAVRELYRVLHIQWEKARLEQKGFWEHIKVIICVICEFDNAYRYRVQDFLIEMNKKALKKHPIKEIRRVLDLMIERENREALALKWRRMKLALTFLLFFKPSIKKKIVEILCDIEQQEIAFEEDDWFCIAMRRDYKFGGLTSDEVISLDKFQQQAII